ncbi:hypothetical protein GC722_05225 [Auraticoccus sp. F435]|uniref:Uncharacterized protein n=1 Tax=Auraticoccus cholistanensis TaxID=2656650 RepID=A0A6A9URV1_9ACTN|nr:hypothetical protein [Auraticoccus cholistanensis]MVA75431.1 hypothetical protein [Auraticoccus cholistanensis]
MQTWVFWLVVVLVLGVAVIVVGALRDRHLQRAREQELLRPPARAVPGPGGTAVPGYVLDDDAGRPPADVLPSDLDPAGRSAVAAGLSASVRIGAGMAAPGFTTDAPSGWAVLDRPRVLVCADPVGSIRALLTFLEASVRESRPCVVVAPDLDPVVVRTLEVNRIQRRLQVVAVVAGDLAREAVCAATGASPVSGSDLAAGWLPDAALGRCERWVSDSRRSWVLGGA